jgi:predicted RNA-binding Zn ribbon-like protein
VLGRVQAYVNTVDLEDGPELFSDPNTLRDWLVAERLLEPEATADAADLRNAIAVREAIRGLIGGHSGSALYPVDVATLNGAAVASRLKVRFGADGRARLEPEVGGVVGAMGRVVAAVFAAEAEPDWARLKLCSSPTCRWAYYDHSRNHSSRWCNMASCGNREKARRFRQEHAIHKPAQPLEQVTS